MAVAIETGEQGVMAARAIRPGKPDGADRLVVTATTRPGDAADGDADPGIGTGEAPLAISSTTASLTAPWRSRLSMLTPSICCLASLV